MPYAYACQHCRVIVERDVFNDPDQCYIGNSWDGRKWDWNYCCACYCKFKRHEMDKYSCVYCLLRADMEPSKANFATLQKMEQDHLEHLRKLNEWKLKGFNSIPYDRTLSCRECDQYFVFNVGEQVFFRSKGFNQPRKCKVCRKAPRESRVHSSIQCVQPSHSQVQPRPAVSPRPPAPVAPQPIASTTSEQGFCMIS